MRILNGLKFLKQLGGALSHTDLLFLLLYSAGLFRVIHREIHVVLILCLLRRILKPSTVSACTTAVSRWFHSMIVFTKNEFFS